jgi:hypothetical protein
MTERIYFVHLDVEDGNTPWKSPDSDGGPAAAGADQYRLVGADLGIAQLSIKDRARHLERKAAKTAPSFLPDSSRTMSS